jgi:hypothetical protein
MPASKRMVVAIRQVNEAFGRMLKDDARHRFSIDVTSLGADQPSEGKDRYP